MPDRPKNNIVDMSMGADKLEAIFKRETEANGGVPGYPNVLNAEPIMEAIHTFFDRTGKKKNVPTPDQVRVHILEPENTKNLRDLAEYMIAVGNENGVEGINEAYSIIMVYKPTMEAEAVSTINRDGVQWSADNMMTTKHPRRTRYYLGFISWIAENAPGYDKEPAPEEELNYKTLMEYGLQGDIPPELISIPKQDEQESQTEAETEFQADFEHNAMTAEQNAALEEQITDDLYIDYEELDDLYEETT